MIDHITLTVSNYVQNQVKYKNIVAIAGLKEQFKDDGSIGFGVNHPEIWIARAFNGQEPSSGVHVAITCDTHDQVDAFHKEALYRG